MALFSRVFRRPGQPGQVFEAWSWNESVLRPPALRETGATGSSSGGWAGTASATLIALSGTVVSGRNCRASALPGFSTTRRATTCLGPEFTANLVSLGLL